MLRVLTLCVAPLALGFAPSRHSSFLRSTAGARGASTARGAATLPIEDSVSAEEPLRVVIAGAGVGGLTLANALRGVPHISVSVIEKTSAFKRFGGPIQLASNAMQILKEMDDGIYDQIESRFTWTGNLTNGIKDGLRDEWYAKFDLASPAKARAMPYTGVIERPDLQQILLDGLAEGVVQNGVGIDHYTNECAVDEKMCPVRCTLDDGREVAADVLIGADGIWSQVRSSMRAEPARGEGSGVTYSGYTVFAGELTYASPDNGEIGYKVYIGPNQYFVITDIGNGRYQFYAFLAREPGSAETEEKPDGSVPFLKEIFEGWSPDVHAILDATREDEIQQRDLYDRPPSSFKPWSDGPVALLGDSIHAMMPNLGQGGCQAVEDAMVLAQELKATTSRAQVPAALENYQKRRLVRSAAVQGLSRFASDIIIRGFDTPAKVVLDSNAALGVRFENCNYAGIVTRMLQPILPIFFAVQFNFLYDGYKNEFGLDLKSGLPLFILGVFILAVGAGAVGEGGILLGGFGLDALLSGEAFAAVSDAAASILDIGGL